MTILRLFFGAVALGWAGLGQTACFPDPPTCSVYRPCDDTVGDGVSLIDATRDVIADGEITTVPDSTDEVDLNGDTVPASETDLSVLETATPETFDVSEAESAPLETEVSAEDAAEVETIDEVASETSTHEVDVVARECEGNSDCDRLDAACAEGVCQADGVCLRVPRMGTCDDGDPCTLEDECAGTECIGTAFVCDDSLTCTNDICDGAGGCLTQQHAATCLIGGACYAVGDRNPSNPCQVCKQGTNWSPAADGSCDDGDTCTTGDTCSAGACIGGPSPSDTGDWLSEVGPYPSEISSFELGDGQLVVTGTTTTPWAVGLDEQTGSKVWTTTFELSGSGPEFGGTMRVVAQDEVGWTLGGRLGAGVFRAEDGTTTSVTTTTDEPHATVRVARDGTLSNARQVVLQPELSTGEGTLFGAVQFRESLAIPTATGTRTLTPSGFFDAVVGRESATQRELTWAWHITGSGTEAVMEVVVANGGDLLVPIYATRAVVMSDGVTTTDSLGCNCPQVLLTRFSPSGGLLGAKQLVAGIDEVFSSSGDSRLLVDGTDLVLAGTVYGSSAIFGVPPSFIEYFTTQFFSTGGGETGAGGDGFVARYDAAGALGRSEFFMPIEFGAQWHSASLQDGLVWVVGGASQRALIGSGDAERIVANTVLAAYGRDGALAAVAESTGGGPSVFAMRGPLVVAGPRGAIYIAGSTFAASQVGFGAARKSVTGLYVERINSRGGLYCRSRQ